ncbi:hypothetical protein Tco_0892917, partial [Tanacetum coccineum]
ICYKEVNVVNGVLASGVDLVLVKDYASFALQVMKINPLRKMWRIRACTHQRPQRKEDQYAVSRRSQYVVLKIYVSTLHFLKFSEKKWESMKILENKLESMKILENKLESLKLQENQPAIDGGPIRPWWMYPFERFMKKLKNYVRNKAKSEGSIAEGYVAEEALTFCSHYFWDVTMKFNHPDRNVDCPPPTCHFQVFKSLCKLIGLQSVIRIDHQELKKVIWYVLHNSPKIDTYRAKFKSEFPEKRIPRLVWEAAKGFVGLVCNKECGQVSGNSRRDDVGMVGLFGWFHSRNGLRLGGSQPTTRVSPYGVFQFMDTAYWSPV